MKLSDTCSITEQEKMEFIEGLQDEKEIDSGMLEIVEKLACDGDEFVRSSIARALINFTGEEFKGILIKMLHDKDSLVRAEACDSLSNSRSSDTINALKNIVIKDRCGMVRTYAALAIGDIAVNVCYNKKELCKFFIECLKKERNIGTKIAYYKVLYMLGREEYFNLLAGELYGRRYQNRCAAVNALGDLINSENRATIITTIQKRKATEKSIAVLSTIERILSE